MENTKYDFATLMVALQDHNVHYVGCTYSGSGDSGAIDNIFYLSAEAKVLFEDNDIHLINDLKHISINFEHGKEPSIARHLEDVFYNACLNNIEDWYNNDGGFGTLVLCTTTGEWKNNNNQYHTDVIEHFNDGFITVNH